MRQSTQLLSAALLASVVVIGWLWITLALERASNVELRAKVEAAEAGSARIADTAAPVSSLSKSVAASPVETARPQAASTVPVPPREMSGLDTMLYEQQLMKDPRYREAKRTQTRQRLGWRRTDLIRLLGFTPEQADAAIELEVDERLRWIDEPITDDTSPEAAAEARARYEVFQRGQHDKLRALVGETKRARYQEYIDSWPSRRRVDYLRSELTDENALRDDQVEPMIAAIHAERSRRESELAEYRDSLNTDVDSVENQQKLSKRAAELNREMDARMITAASGILTSAQQKVFRQQLGREQAQSETDRMLHEMWSNPGQEIVERSN